MKKCLTILLIFVCLSLAVYKCLACLLPPIVEIYEDERYTEVGNSIEIIAFLVRGGPNESWDWEPSGIIDFTWQEWPFAGATTKSDTLPGTYTVTAEVTDYDLTDSASAIVHIVAVTDVASVEAALIDENVTFGAITDPPNKASYVTVDWSGGGAPATGSGSLFTTKWNEAGTKTVTATCGTGPNSTTQKSVDIVSISGVSCSPSQLPADGTSESEVSATITPDTRTIIWSIDDPDLGCTISSHPTDPSKRIITAGTSAGTITVRATDSELSSCTSTTTIDLVNPVVVDSVTVDKTTAAAGDTVTFTANPNPTGSSLSSIQWERQYRPDSSSAWGAWETASGGDNTAQLTTTTAGFYVYRARNGSSDTWKESPIVTIVAVDTVVEASTSNEGPLYKAVGDSFALEAKPLPSGASCPGGGIDWSMESYPTGGDWSLPPSSPTFIVPVQITYPGNYTIRGKCGSSDTGDSIDIVVVEVSNITFSYPELYTDGASTSDADATIVPAGRTIEWSIVDNALGCIIDPSTGVITAGPGTSAGTITVRAADSVLSDCYVEATIDIIDLSVAIVTPDFPVSIAFGNNLLLDCTPSGVTTGTYSWTKASGPGVVTFSLPIIKNPTFSASQPGEYTVRVGYSVGGTTVYDTSGTISVVEVSNVAFSPTELYADGTSTSQAYATITPPGRPIVWSIQSADPLGCTINPSTGVITAGTTTGTITVRATDLELSNCYDEATININNVDIGVDIVTPSFPSYIAFGDTLQLDCTPTGILTGTYNWTKASGPGIVTFSNPNIKNPTFSVNQSGYYTVRVGYTVGDTTVYDTSGTIGYISVTNVISSADYVCVDDNVTFGAITEPLNCATYVTITWSTSADANPSSGNGDLFTTNWSTGGTKTVTATCGTSSAQKNVEIVSIQIGTFSPPELHADGASTSQASATITPSSRTIIWSIVNDALGCTINPSSGLIRAGTTAGTITVQATDSVLSSCFDQATIDITENTSISVVINVPSESSAYVRVGDELALGCLPDPPRIETGGQINWSYTGPGNVVFSPNSTDENITFSADKVGEYNVTVVYTVGDVEAFDTKSIIVFIEDIDVDSNRDGAVEDASDDVDDVLEDDQWAIVPVNCDDDNGDSIRDCDASEYDYADSSDLIPIIIRRWPLPIEDWTITLTCSDTDMELFNIFDHNKNLITDWDGGVHELDDVEERIPLKDGDLTYYIEAKRFREPGDADDFTLKLTVTGPQIYTDEVKIRQSSFILLPATHDALKVYVGDVIEAPGVYDPFVDALSDKVSSLIDVYMGWPYVDPDYPDVWFQDELEIGYTSWPNHDMHVVWNLLRDRPYITLGSWVRDQLGQDMGYIENPVGASNGEGGDIEVIPRSMVGGNGLVITGSTSKDIKDFIVAQGVQTIQDSGVETIITCDENSGSGTNWLATSHIDEVISFNNSLAVADCDKAIEILDKMNMVCTGTVGGGSGTVGNTSVYTTTSWSPSLRYAVPCTMSEDGTIQSIAIYHHGGTGNVLLGLYENNAYNKPGTLLGVTAETAVSTSEGWQTINLTSPVEATQDQTLWLAWIFQNSVRIRYTIQNPPGRVRSDDDGWTEGMANPFGTSYGGSYTYSIYANYATSGGGGGSNTLVSSDITDDEGWPIDPSDSNWLNGFVEITSGDGLGQVRQISGITQDGPNITITMTRDWDTDDPPGSGSGFEIVAGSAYRAMFVVTKDGYREECGVATGADMWNLFDNTKTGIDAWSGQYNNQGPLYSLIAIVEGTGAGQIRRIESSQGDAITVSRTWNSNEYPADDSRYVIVKGSKKWGFRYPFVYAQDSYYHSDFFPIAMTQNDTAFTVVRRFLTQYRNEQGINQDHIDLIKQQLTSVLSLSFDERVPAIYRGSPAEAWLPAMTNLLNAGGLIIPEPCVVYPYDDAFNEKFKQTLEGTYIDDWYFLHTGNGEIHCGTNVKRDPGVLKEWWKN